MTSGGDNSKLFDRFEPNDSSNEKMLNKESISKKTFADTL